MQSGILLVDKPQGLTSHDVVSRVRRVAGTRKVGHAGTLDPMATGLLVVGVNSSTRLLTYLVGADKRYEATILLGRSTASDDADGETVAVADAAQLASVTDVAIDEAVAALTGDIEQVPNAVSAIKVDGRRAYDRARAGEDVQLSARPVRVDRFEVLERRRLADTIELDVVVDCGSGTYIRALARDLGSALGVGGHLTRLRRTRVGGFDVADAAGVDELVVPDGLLTPAAVAETVVARWDVDEPTATALAQGKKLPSSLPDGLRAAIAPGERLIGVVRVAGGVVRSVTNFPSDEVRAPSTDGAAS
ncbi:tRNA pseudouridine synthase B [Mycetocola reblochoni REB411]|uniref:tRNA pseudouridine synthase B n=1 Tax=Mycetocola reblochoni REB411 TaxID=1255698 RepID=A0A1R4JU00_9MICO|nr:tRNA pseudouridine synthase B [Mycetocola reblochoni REB411]